MFSALFAGFFRHHARAPDGGKRVSEIEVRFVPILLQKSFSGEVRKF
jgi:hypothetical protein